MVKHRRKSRLLPSIQNKLLEQFVAGVSARTAAELTGVNRNTAILFFHKLREIIVEKMAAEAPFLAGEIEVDESYFGGVRKGKRGRGAAGKVPVFGLLKRGGKVYAMMIEDATAQTLLGIIRDRIQPDSIVYTDSFRSYDVLDVSEFHHVRINHSETFVERKAISTASRTFETRLSDICAAATEYQKPTSMLRRENNFIVFFPPSILKECEWRFNHRPARNLLKTLSEWVKV